MVQNLRGHIALIEDSSVASSNLVRLLRTNCYCSCIETQRLWLAEGHTFICQCQYKDTYRFLKNLKRNKIPNTWENCSLLSSSSLEMIKTNNLYHK